LITVVWMCIEVTVAVIAAVRAHSVALLAFGGDSAIELLSGLTVLLRFTGKRLSEERAARITAVLLFLLALFIVVASVLSLSRSGLQPQPSYLGMGLLIAAATLMPWLASQKRKLAVETASAALAADAVQSSLCAYLSWVALLGLAANSLFRISWADPAAALAIVPIVVKEGKDAWQHRGCHCT
jgi:divalent metal cation (Fe/Co/Zn/Cd) transporter